MPIPLGILAATASSAPAGTFDLLETVSISTTTASISFTNLNNYFNYKHLQIRATMRGASTGTTTGSITIRFNGDTATNYNFRRMNNSGTSVSASVTYSNGDITLINIVPQNGQSPGNFGGLILDIADFLSANKSKTIRTHHGTGINATNYTSGAWRSSSAITSIEIATAASFFSGTRFSIYGVK